MGNEALIDEVGSELPAQGLEPIDPWKVLTVSDLRWANLDQTILICRVEFEGMPGTHPFAANATDPELHCREIFRRATDDEEWGEILPYVPPSLEKLRANMPALEKWRLEAMVDIYGAQNGIDLRGNIDAAVESLPEPDRTIAKSKRQNVNLYYRTDPLFDFIGINDNIGVSPEMIDELWARALAL